MKRSDEVELMGEELGRGNFGWERRTKDVRVRSLANSDCVRGNYS